MKTGAIRVSLEARLYALKELCRRAGLGSDDLSSRWRIEAGCEGCLSLRKLAGQGSQRILFPAFDSELSAEFVVRKSWPREARSANDGTIPDFVVPFCRHDSVPAEPLFREVAPGEFHCTEDLLAPIVLVLSRFEEIDAPRRDAHGRFESADSLAAGGNYLDRPIVDEYGLALEQVIEMLDPGFRPAERRLRVKISHDVDLVGIPFGLREPVVQLLARRDPWTALRDALSFTGMVPGSLAQVMEICRKAGERGLHSALYWKASPPGRFDSGYDIGDSRIARVMDWARSHSIEMGVHPGYGTYLQPAELGREVDRCRKAIGSNHLGGRQHYLRWSPETWLHWEQCGLSYDSSVGYADRAGFRAGTCRPYLPWLWKENRRAELLEIPLIVMDRTLVSAKYLGQSPEESLSLVRTMMRKCAAVGGVLTLLWHNNCLGRPFSAHYPAIFDALSGTENFDWEAEKQGLRD